MTRIFAIEFGGFFYGTLEQFADCFPFGNPTEETIREFAADQGCHFHSYDGELIDFTGLSNVEAEIALLAQIQEATDTPLFH